MFFFSNFKLKMLIILIKGKRCSLILVNGIKYCFISKNIGVKYVLRFTRRLSMLCKTNGCILQSNWIYIQKKYNSSEAKKIFVCL